MKPVRALFDAVHIPTGTPPYATAHVKLYYPAAPQNTETEKRTGIIPAEKEASPMPVVVFCGGINVGMGGYHWLAVQLAAVGIVTVLYSYVAHTLPNVVGLTPGIDLDKVTPDTYGRGPTSPVLAPILKLLERLNTEPTSPVHNSLALSKIVLGGHSAGGTVALQNAQYFEQIVGSFAYAGHTMASTMLGFAPKTILPIGEKPVLLMYGDQDGVIHASSQRYGVSEHGTNPVQLTLKKGYTGRPEKGHAVCVKGANHFSIVHPQDHTTGRAFLDQPDLHPEQTRTHLFSLVCAFIQQITNSDLASRQKFADAVPAVTCLSGDLLDFA
jgi:pimeloyl-ACP methyl ester carboxylesterase